MKICVIRGNKIFNNLESTKNTINNEAKKSNTESPIHNQTVDILIVEKKKKKI